MNTVQMPKLTAAQILAVVKDALAVIVAFGVPLTQTEQVALLALAASTTALLLTADTILRHSRLKHVAGPLLDQAAASTILEAQVRANATFATEPIKPATQPATQTDVLASEAELEAQAHAANEAADPAGRQADLAAAATVDEPEPGVDPATLD